MSPGRLYSRLTSLSEGARVALLLGTVGIVLHAAVLPGIFTLDEDNYLTTVVALREGRLSLPATEGLPPSIELNYFDPSPHSRRSFASPTFSTAPPLHAPLGWAFSFFGWRGLYSINILGFLACAAMVFVLTRRHARRTGTAWLAMVVWMLGGFGVEYALGVWPHALSFALVTAAVVLADQARRESSVWAAAAGGLLVGLAAGVRYQNAVIGAALGAGIVLTASRRLRTSAGYAAGFALPLLASSVMNRLRCGWWNPTTKGGNYTRVAGGGASTSVLEDAMTSLLARVVDFTFQPPDRFYTDPGLRVVPESGAFVVVGAVKKSLLQSSPWLVLAMLALVLAWRRRSSDDGPAHPRVTMRLFAVVWAAVLGLFALAGPARHEGLCFNQRYLLELLPLGACAAAWAIEPLRPNTRALLAGLAAGTLAGAIVVTRHPDDLLRQVLLLRVPLALAALLLLAWAAARLRPRCGPALTALFGVCLGWSAAAHLGDDVVASFRVRSVNLAKLDYARSLLTTDRPAAIVGWRPVAYGPLQLEHDLALIDVSRDEGRDAARVVDALLARGRRVLLDPAFMPAATARAAMAGHPVRLVGSQVRPFIEIGTTPK